MKILGPDGPLSVHLKDYEERQEQNAMLKNVVDAYNDEQIALIEAGTGTGKSLAYLIPAMLFALQNGTPCVISTNTIALQEQLLEKDIPFLTKALNLNIKAALLKGMNNYLCLRKLADSQYEKRFLNAEEMHDYETIEAWSAKTLDGSKSELSFVPQASIWEKVGAEAEACTYTKCPHYKECFFFKARKQAADAQLLIVNHHLLFADLAARSEVDNYKDQIILPPYQHIVIDEAHHIEDVATEYFAEKISRLGLTRQLSRLLAEKKNDTSGKFIILKQKLEECFPEKDQAIQALMHKIEIDLPAERRNLLRYANELFETMYFFSESLAAQDEDNPSAKKLRLRAFHYQQPIWLTQITDAAKQLLNELGRFCVSLEYTLKQIETTDEQLAQKTEGIRADCLAIVRYLKNTHAIVENFVFTAESSEFVKWIEINHTRNGTNVLLIRARLEISDILRSALFSKFKTIVLCSATLTANCKFDYLKNRLGLQLPLSEKSITENSYESPFDFAKQALIAIPSDMPEPHLGSFAVSACEKIWHSLEASHGNAFVLFTSYTMLNTCYKILIARLEKAHYHTLRQGDDSRKALLEKFKTSSQAVLFGTDSFWEGVDVVGEALRCVIIVKLPFKVPSEPLIQARAEAITARGGNPFMEYIIPAAIVKFKQGFGRLIRNRKDRGCVVCLDTRLIKKGYGKMFLNSLPPCQQYVANGIEVKEKMAEFYRKTYYLTK